MSDEWLTDNTRWYIKDPGPKDFVYRDDVENRALETVPEPVTIVTMEDYERVVESLLPGESRMVKVRYKFGQKGSYGSSE